MARIPPHALPLLVLSSLSSTSALPPSHPSSKPNLHTHTKRTDQWPRKQIGVIIGCALGALIILFLWGWFLKGSKMWQGSRILWWRSHFGFSEESRRRAMEIRTERRRKRKEEVARIWGSGNGVVGGKWQGTTDWKTARGESVSKPAPAAQSPGANATT